MDSYDYLIVGAGLSGLVTAERLAYAGKSALVIDLRDHIGGNCFDTADKNGLTYHVYGPHYFRTSKKDVLEYLSKFTEWVKADYKVRVCSHNKLWSFPINLETFEQWTGKPETEESFIAYLKNIQKTTVPNNSKEAIINQVGRDFYNLFYKDYTRKQWGRDASMLDSSVCKRIPIRTNWDDRYFSDDFQGLPAKGYTSMMQSMWETTIQQNPKSAIRLSAAYRDVIDSKAVAYKHLIFTGPLDEFFDYSEGELPYRSLRFQLNCYNQNELHHSKFFQSHLQINYAGDEEFTRKVEVKHITGQGLPGTNVVTEYPQEFIRGENERFYPIPNTETARIVKRYKEKAAELPNTTFLGRMGTYRYMNMDQVVEEALALSTQLIKANAGSLREENQL